MFVVILYDLFSPILTSNFADVVALCTRLLNLSFLTK